MYDLQTLESRQNEIEEALREIERSFDLLTEQKKALIGIRTYHEILIRIAKKNMVQKETYEILSQNTTYLASAYEVAPKVASFANAALREVEKARGGAVTNSQIWDSLQRQGISTSQKNPLKAIDYALYRAKNKNGKPIDRPFVMTWRWIGTSEGSSLAPNQLPGN